MSKPLMGQKKYYLFNDEEISRTVSLVIKMGPEVKERNLRKRVG
jgi:hypothetical protein